MVPVSVRTREQRGALGNQVAAMWAPLPVGVENPADCLRRVADAMDDLKSSGQAVGAQVLTDLAGFAPPTILSQAARLQARQPFFNLVVTNVPGPQIPLYLLGHRLELLYPVVPLAQRQALGIAVMSYDGHLGFGLLGDYDALPELEAIALDLKWAIDSRSARAAGVAHRAEEAGPRTGPRPQEARRRRRRARRTGAARHRGPPAPAEVRLALCQINATVGDIAGNTERVREGILAARRAGAELVLFPELVLTGYPPEDLLLKEHFLADAGAALASLAADCTDICAIVGFPERAEDVYNAAAVLAEGSGAGCLPQGLPPKLRSVRRAALLPGGRRRRAGPRRGAHDRADRLRGHLGVRASSER